MQIGRVAYYEFDDFRIDVEKQKLYKNGKSVALSHKAFEVLLILILRPNQIVEKEYLLSEIWTDSFVEESNLTQYIHILRKTLGQNKNPKSYIETINKIGYRLTADVRAVTADEIIPASEKNSVSDVSTEHKGLSGEDSFTRPKTDLGKINHNTSFRQAIFFWFKQNKFRAALAAVLFCLVLATVGFGIRFAFRPVPLFLSRFSKTEVSKITANGNVSFVTVSPDGKYLAIVEKRGVNQSLQLRQLDNPAAVEIVPPKKQQFVGVTFSPDGSRIYFVTYDLEKGPDATGLVGKLYEVPALGGPARQIICDIDSPVSISPGGRRFAFVRNYLAENQSAVIIADPDTKEEIKLAVRSLSERFSESGLDWSPDEKTIAATAIVSAQNETYMTALAIESASGEQRTLTSEKWQWAAHPNWLEDGSGIVFAAFSNDSPNQSDEIWQISYPGGKTRKISGGINGIDGLSLTNDSKLILAVKSERLSSFWVSPARNLKQARKITQNLTEYYFVKPGISWLPDGRLIFGETLNGNLDIWTMNSDGTQKKQITTDLKADSMPIASFDGEDIFFISDRSGQRNLWRMKFDGSNPRQITHQEGVFSPSLSRDGKYVFYSAVDKVSRQPWLYKISVDGSDLVRLTSSITLLPESSPDGKWIACFYPAVSAKSAARTELKLTILSADGGQVVKQFGTFDRSTLFAISWFDKRTLTYITNENDGSRLWRQLLDKKEPEVIFDSPADLIFRFAWSRDGQNLVYERGNLINDIILIRSVEN